MKKVVNYCGNCPFLYSDYDDYAMGYSTLDICTLSKFLKYKDYIVSKHDSIGFNEDSKTPEWCPIRKEKFELIFNDKNDEIENNDENIVQDDFKEQIDKVQEQISLLEEAGDKLKILFENLDQLSNDDNLNKLNDILNDFKNEDN